MYKAIGLMTKKVYITGTKEDCFRELSMKFPNKLDKDKVYPEPLRIIRRKK